MEQKTELESKLFKFKKFFMSTFYVILSISKTEKPTFILYQTEIQLEIRI